jgi:hypothetical protein
VGLEKEKQEQEVQDGDASTTPMTFHVPPTASSKLRVHPLHIQIYTVQIPMVAQIDRISAALSSSQK